ncbi:SufE family protein [Nostocoides vanveenii]|uniref:SufE family protein n=1 Tax=Nostocoides vanveenii TaxID=330835 RepID=A0ABP4W420_9MICO
MSADPTAGMPPALAEIATDFREASAKDRVQLLLEFGEDLPDLPPRYADAPEKLEQVHECQSPLFLAVEVGAQPGVRSDDQRVGLFFSAPREAPTTRGFAGILHAGLDGASAAEILATPEHAPMNFALAEVISPLRMRGMVAMLSRIKRQVRLQIAARDDGA